MPQLFRVIAPRFDGMPDHIRDGLVGHVFPQAENSGPRTWLGSLFPVLEEPVDPGAYTFAVWFSDAMEILSGRPDIRDWFLTHTSSEQQDGFIEFDREECESVPDLEPPESLVASA